MRKHIKSVLLEKDGKQFVQIIAQSHRGFHFGVESLWFRHGKFSLGSCGFPESWVETSQNPQYCKDLGECLVRGEIVKRDNELIEVPTPEWLEQYKATIRAYNEYEFDDLEVAPESKPTEGYAVIEEIK